MNASTFNHNIHRPAVTIAKLWLDSHCSVKVWRTVYSTNDVQEPRKCVTSVHSCLCPVCHTAEGERPFGNLHHWEADQLVKGMLEQHEDVKWCAKVLLCFLAKRNNFLKSPIYLAKADCCFGICFVLIKQMRDLSVYWWALEELGCVSCFQSMCSF